MKVGDLVGGTPGGTPDAELRRACHEMEAVFLRQLFETMRASMGEEGLGEESPGEEMFRAMLDDRMASEAAQKMQRGLGEALYRQLAARFHIGG